MLACYSLAILVILVGLYVLLKGEQTADPLARTRMIDEPEHDSRGAKRGSLGVEEVSMVRAGAEGGLHRAEEDADGIV